MPSLCDKLRTVAAKLDRYKSAGVIPETGDRLLGAYVALLEVSLDSDTDASEYADLMATYTELSQGCHK